MNSFFQQLITRHHPAPGSVAEQSPRPRLRGRFEPRADSSDGGGTTPQLSSQRWKDGVLLAGEEGAARGDRAGGGGRASGVDRTGGADGAGGSDGVGGVDGAGGESWMADTNWAAGRDRAAGRDSAAGRNGTSGPDWTAGRDGIFGRDGAAGRGRMHGQDWMSGRDRAADEKKLSGEAGVAAGSGQPMPSFPGGKYPPAGGALRSGAAWNHAWRGETDAGGGPAGSGGADWRNGGDPPDGRIVSNGGDRPNTGGFWQAGRRGGLPITGNGLSPMGVFQGVKPGGPENANTGKREHAAAGERPESFPAGGQGIRPGYSDGGATALPLPGWLQDIGKELRQARPRQAMPQEQAPVIKVTIGRIEVKATINQVAPESRKNVPQQKPRLSLDEFLKVKKDPA